MRIGVLASGSGTNLQAILDAGLPVVVVIADRAATGALDRASAAGISTELIEREAFLPDRAAFTDAIVGALKNHEVDLVAMAGFMTILSGEIFDEYPGHVINTHPSLLPVFRGAHAIADALAAGVKVTGCTIHVATANVDEGPILAQEVVPVFGGDTVESLTERIKAAEHDIYPKILWQLVDNAS